ncbi:MAG: hypothetical protein WC043_07390 [Pseudobdellovibrionaceae bacterium]
MLSEKLHQASQNFVRMGVVSKDVIPPQWTAPSIPDDPSAGLAAFQIALVQNFERTCRHSIDQMHLCFGIAKVLQFYRDAIVHNDEFWRGNAQMNGIILSDSLHIYNQDIKNCNTYLQAAIEGWKARPDALPVERETLISHATQLGQLAQQGLTASQRVVHFNARVKAGQPYYDPHEKPELPHGQDATSFAKEFYAKAAFKAEELIEDHEDMVRLVLARAYFVQRTVVPANPQNLEDWSEDLTDNQRIITRLSERLALLKEHHEGLSGFTRTEFIRRAP